MGGYRRHCAARVVSAAPSFPRKRESSHYATRPWLAGGFVWTGFDYCGEPTPYGWPCVNSLFGLLDSCGFPKENAFYYKAGGARSRCSISSRTGIGRVARGRRSRCGATRTSSASSCSSTESR